MEERLGILELTSEQIHDVAYKNKWIAGCQKEYLAIVDKNQISGVKILELIQKEDMFACGDVLVFCAGEAQDAVQLLPENVPECFSLQIIALAFSREMLSRAGNYNEKLKGMTDFEFLCRLSKANGNAIFVFPGMEEEVFVVNAEDAYTCAYIVRSYMKELQDGGTMEGLLTQVCYGMEQCGVLGCFKEALNRFITDQKNYEQIVAATAPIVVLRGDDTCFGVLKGFADSLFYHIKRMGQACILAEQGKTDYEYLMNHVCKAIIGFQSKAFRMEFFKNLRGPKMQFWFDNPVFYEYHFADLSEDCYILCHDANYVEYIKEYFGRQNAMMFPPAGCSPAWPECDEKPYDIVFIGSYQQESDEVFKGLDKAFYEYMLAHPELTFVKGMQSMLAGQGMDASLLDYSQLFAGIKPICQSVINHYRKKVMETILAAGYEVHVYGDSWDAFQSPNAHRLIRHPEVTVEESVGEWQKAKIGLNIMSWHKAGMTERIANIMLAGAVCLSEETSYLKEHFEEGKEIVTFRLSGLEELPGKIEQLLKDNQWKKIARNGYEVACRKHTWEQRAWELLELVESII